MCMFPSRLIFSSTHTVFTNSHFEIVCVLRVAQPICVVFVIQCQRTCIVSAALQRVGQILDGERHPVCIGTPAEDAAAASSSSSLHSYDDKFAVTEFCTNTAIAALVNALATLGLNDSGGSTLSSSIDTALPPTTTTTTNNSMNAQATVLSWVHGNSNNQTSNNENTDKNDEMEEDSDQKKSTPSKKKTVTLRFLAEDTCTFFKEEDVEIVDSTPTVETTSTTTNNNNNSKTTTASGVGGFFGTGSSHNNNMSNNTGKEEVTQTTTRVVRRVKEYHWKVGIRYQILLFPGTPTNNLEQNAIVLQQRSAETILVTQQLSSTGAAAIPRNRNAQKSPIPERTVHPPVDANLTWLWSMIHATDQSCQFAIPRNTDTCRTPRRNAPVDAAVACLQGLNDWARITRGYFVQRVEEEILKKDNPVHPRRHPQQPTVANHNLGSSVIMEPGDTGTMQGLAKEPTFNGQRIRIVEYNREQQRYKAEPVDSNAGLPPTLSIKPANIRPDNQPPAALQQQPLSPTNAPPLQSIVDQDIFCPVLPLLENGSVLPLADVNDLLQEQSRSLDEAVENLYTLYPPRHLMKLVSVTEATIVMLCKHLEQLTVQHHGCVDYVEDLLKQQLVAAIGKEISRTDFEQFMRFYYPKFMRPMYCPSPFSRAIGRPGHYPDGILSIEATLPSSSSTRTIDIASSSSSAEPIATWVKSIAGVDSPSIFIPIHATASVEITGDCFLHGWMQHRFLSKPKPEFQLACRARQFSSFLIILGTVSGPDKFEPKDAIVLQNKDEVLIPLLTTVLPSAKEFKDAIHSLSPEQQEFAKAFRGMQLESSVFGICVVQIKPQLEKLLGLPNGALTKEIQLTQDLMSLFIEYQVPSDLMTFDGAAESTQAEKLDAVRGHVSSIKAMIEASKANQLKDEAMKADMRAEMAFAGPEAAVSVQAAPVYSMMTMQGVANDQSQLRGSSLRSIQSNRRRLLSAVEGRSPTNVSVQEQSMTQQQRRMNENVKSDRKQSTPNVPPQSVVGNNTLVGTFLSSKESSDNGLNAISAEDFTMIPKLLDAKIEALDNDNALRSTTIKAGRNWTRTRQENFLTRLATRTLGTDEIVSEKKMAFDLLDAISRSGTLAIDCAELHVFIAMSHCFENDVLGTVVQDNINPIAKVEQSSLLLASTIHGQDDINQFIEHDTDRQRIQSSFPRLFNPSRSITEVIEEE